MTYTFSATGLPPGLSIVSNRILGTPATPGNYTAIITVSDGVSSVSQTVSITIAGAAVPIPFWKLILSADCGSYSLDSARAQIQVFAEAGSYWRDNVAIATLLAAESGSYWLDSVESAPLFVAEAGSYWLDSAEAAIAESGSYWLDSAVESPVFVAETGVYWLDSVEAAIAESGSYWLDSVEIISNRATFNSIIYTPTSSATSYFTGNPASVNDGFTTGTGNRGMIYNGGNSFPLTITSSSPFYWNRFILYGGQFNGSFNCPGRITIYAADGTTLLYQGALFTANTLTPLTQELGAVSGLDTPRSVYQVVFDQPPDNANSISIFEFQIFGS